MNVPKPLRGSIERTKANGQVVYFQRLRFVRGDKREICALNLIPIQVDGAPVGKEVLAILSAVTWRHLRFIFSHSHAQKPKNAAHDFSVDSTDNLIRGR